MDKQKVLIVDDDENIAELIALNLMKECFDTHIVSNGEEALKKYKEFAPDIILLDIMLPGIDGYEILREIRKDSSTPVIMLSAKGETFDKVLGLELGADDYITKPFDNKEMVARVKAVLRRFTVEPAKESDEEKENAPLCVYLKNLTINLTDYTVYFHDKRIDIPPKELELFYFLASHPNQVFTREQLLDRIWSYDYIGDTRTIDVHIKRLREKFNEPDAWRISTVWGIGYKFDIL
ncbi:MAG: response regulator transcription factor [Lachnospiraceae bacterium]|nr:response regulator transcription factor [Lachnospiraceae bacterium]